MIERSILLRALVTCLVVGTALTAVNHGPSIVRGASPAEMSWQIAITFAIPFGVAVFAGVTAVRGRTMPHAGVDRFPVAVATETFPELNPNPVLRFAVDGTLLYANPAGAPIAERLRLMADADPQRDVVTRLVRAARTAPGAPLAVAFDGRRYVVRPVEIPGRGFVNVYATEIVGARRPSISAA